MYKPMNSIDAWFNLEKRACQFASDKHKNQVYAKFLPYTHHLAAVVGVLRRFGVFDPTVLSAAWLRDTVEDQGVKTADLLENFGQDVSFLVWSVTNEPGKNRKERAAKTYPKVRATTETRVLKLADRIANIEACLRNNWVDQLFDMYSREHDAFVAALRGGPPSDDLNDNETEEAMWNYLCDLVRVGRDMKEKIGC